MVTCTGLGGSNTAPFTWPFLSNTITITSQFYVDPYTTIVSEDDTTGVDNDVIRVEVSSNSGGLASSSECLAASIYHT